MRSLTMAVAFGATLLSFLLLLAVGAFLAGVEESGARGAGVLLALSAAVAFGAAAFLIWAPAGYFGHPLRRPLGVVITLAAAAPPTTLAVAALAFTGLPLGTRLPLMDWPLFVAGLVLALGAVCVWGVGYRRLGDASGRAGRAPQAGAGGIDDAEIRVTRV
jgi:hypothetical protein